MRVFVRFSALSIMLLLAGCAPQTIKQTVEAMPNNTAASKLKRIAVLGFSGPDGPQATAEFESLLTQANINGAAYFTVIDRRTLVNAINEIKFYQTGLVDDQKIAKLGKLIGADGIYTGTTATAPPAVRQWQESRVTCGPVTQGKMLKCNNPSRTTVSCSEQTVSYTISARLVEIATGQVIFAPTKTGTRSSSNCADGNGMEPASLMLGAAARDALAQLRDDVAPHTYVVELKFKEITAGLNDVQKARFSGALEFAKVGRIDRACEAIAMISREGLDDSKGGGLINLPTLEALPPPLALKFNSAVCVETSGDLSAAQMGYMAVDRELIRPDNDVNQALSRVGRKLAERVKAERDAAAQIIAAPVQTAAPGTKIPSRPAKPKNQPTP